MIFICNGRVAISSSLDVKNVGSRLNLSGQGGIGGRLEENDYVELRPIFHLNELLGSKSFPVMDVRFSLVTILVREYGLSQFYEGKNSTSIGQCLGIKSDGVLS